MSGDEGRKDKTELRINPELMEAIRNMPHPDEVARMLVSVDPVSDERAAAYAYLAGNPNWSFSAKGDMPYQKRCFMGMPVEAWERWRRDDEAD